MDNESVVLVTGIGGFLGGHLYRALRDTWPKARIVGVSRFPPNDRGECVSLDLLERASLQSFVDSLRPEYVFHLAGVIHAADWNAFYRGNVETTLNLLEAFLATPCRPRVVISGSAAEYGWVTRDNLPITEALLPNPISPYGVSKAWQTLCGRSFRCKGLPVVVGRVFNIVGSGVPESSSLGSFAHQLRRMKSSGAAQELRVGNLRSLRDFIDVSDMCRALIAVALHGHTGELYNICSGVSVGIHDALDTLISLSGMPVKVVVDDTRFRSGDVPNVHGSHDKITRDTGWTPQVPFSTSLKAMLE